MISRAIDLTIYGPSQPTEAETLAKIKRISSYLLQGCKPMSVRAKMVLESVIPYSYGGSQAIFRCSYDPKLSVEDVSFQKATPSGEARFQIDNPSALQQMVIGKAYYFDITPAD